jgi:pimeloyl-ACP methyl ester carboxylesterase
MPGWKILLSLLPVLGGLLLALWVFVVLALWWQQDRLVFAGWGFRLVEASGLGAGDERLAWVTPDGVRLVGALRRARRPSEGLLLVFGGNAEDTDWRLRQLGARIDHLDIATFFYRGYGPSAGQPDQASIVADATMIHDDLVARLRPARVIAAGYSLGSGVAAQLARLRPLAGAVLVTPFDSIVGVAAQRYPWAPVRWLLRHPFRSDEALANLDLPVAVIAATHDHVVPPARTRRLLEALRRPVLVVWIDRANHVSLYDQPAYHAAFAQALRLLIDDAGDQAGATAAAPSSAPAAGWAATGASVAAGASTSSTEPARRPPRSISSSP